jgi:hypothetical protein
MNSRDETEVAYPREETSLLLTPDNYQKGFLVDEEWMAGVSIDPDQPEVFLAFVLRHTTGEYLGCHSYSDLSEALSAVNRIPRGWKYEKAGGCGGCGQNGKCSGGKCGQGKCGSGNCS